MIYVKYKIYFLILSLMMFSGCDLGDKNNEPLSDAELIQMIIDASKLEIDMDDLPEQSLEYINNDISYDEIASRVASGLGFEVELVGNGYRSGDRNEFYFNLEGRKLDPNDWGNKRSEGDRQDKEDWQCFDLIYPVTFEMPDGSTIIVENVGLVKSLYTSNSFLGPIVVKIHLCNHSGISQPPSPSISAICRDECSL